MDKYGASRCLCILVSVYLFLSRLLHDAYTCRGSNGAGKRISQLIFSELFMFSKSSEFSTSPQEKLLETLGQN